MYKIETTSYGFRLIFGGFIKKEEMNRWLQDFAQNSEKMTKGWSVFVDMRTLKPLSKESQEIMEKGQKLANQKGLKRSVVILSDPITTFQFREIAKQTGIYAIERYIDASREPQWEKRGMDWLMNGIDPEKTKPTDQSKPE